MFNFDRLESEYQYIRSSSYTPASKLSSLYGVTERTIRNDVAAMNHVLEQHGASILLKRRAGYYLHVEDEDALAAFEDPAVSAKDPELDLTSAGNRLKVVIKALLDSDDYVQYPDIASMAIVVQSTVQGYMRQVKTILARYDLECVAHRSRGVKVFGSECDKRACYFNEVIMDEGEGGQFSGFTQAQRYFFSEVDLDALERRMLETLSREGIVCTDLALSNLVLSVALIAVRVSKGRFVDQRWAGEMPSESFSIVREVSACVEEVMGLSLPEGEQGYVYRQLLAYTDLGGGYIDAKRLSAIVDRLIEAVRDNYGFDFSGDFLLRNGLTEHLKSTAKRESKGHGRRNPLTDTIRRSFPLAYEITIASVNEVFSATSLEADEDDIGYIALHIGAAIERRRAALYSKKRALVVCDAGRAALGVLTARLNLLFADRIEVVRSVSKQEYMRTAASLNGEIDVIISTVSHLDGPVVSIPVDFRLLDDDVKSISHWLETSRSLSAQQLACFFDSDLFFVFDHAHDKREVLEGMCRRLIDRGLSDGDMLQLVLEREGLSSTAISERMAIPHPIKLCARETRVAVGILRRPVAWREHDGDGTKDRVRLVFLLSLKQQSASEISRLYDVLTKVANDEGLQSELIAAPSYNAFMDVLASIEP